MVAIIVGVCASPESPTHGTQYDTIGGKLSILSRGLSVKFRAFRFGRVFPIKDCRPFGHALLV